MPVEKTVISNTPGVYECFPCLTRTQSGRLITVYRESDSHGAAAYSHLVLRHSDGEGAKWSERQVLIESHRQEGVLFKWNCPRIGELAEGRLYVLCDGYPVPPGEAQTCDSRVFFWWSEDEGETWSEPRKTAIFGIVPDKLLVTAAGTWLVAAHEHETAAPFITQWVFRSEDAGSSWQPTVVCRQEGLNPCEASLIQLPEDGLLVCYMRENSGLGRPGPKCLSRDDGRHWEGPYDTDMIGCHRPVAGFLPSGNIMVTHRHTCRGQLGSAKNFFAFRESQESAREPEPSQQGGIILPLDHDRWNPPDQGYSGWANLPEGRTFVVNYIRDEGPLAQIRGYWLREEDF
jgi:BNR repeat-like domain